MTNQTQRFHGLFTGFDGAHGQTRIGEDNYGVGKQKADSCIVRAPLTLELIQGHLDGKLGVGSIPINADNHCSFGAIDIDVYEGFDHSELEQKLQAIKLTGVVCRSKSGGAHVFFFFKEAIPASVFKEKAAKLAVYLGHGGSEIFPKQDELNVERGDVGNFINLPYFNANETMRVAVKPDGSYATFEEFLDLAEGRRLDPDEFLSIKLEARTEVQPKTTTKTRRKAEPVDQGEPAGYPPCLQKIFEAMVPVDRNEVLSFASVIAKKEVGDKWESRVEEINKTYCGDPLPQKEVDQITKSYSKKDYGYSCKKEPFKSHCNRAACFQQKYGIGPDPGQFTELVRVDWPKKIYFIKYSYEIPGSDSGETTAKFICLSNAHPSKQNEVLESVLSQTSIKKPRMEDKEWALTVHDLMKKVTVIQPDMKKEIIELGDELAEPIHKVLFPNLRIKTTTDFNTLKNRTHWIFDIQVPETVGTGETASPKLRTKTVQLEERQLQARTYAEAVNNEGGINAFVACDQTHWGITRAFAAAGAPRITPETESPEELIIRCLTEMLSSETNHQPFPKDFNRGQARVKITQEGSNEVMFAFRTLHLMKLYNNTGSPGGVSEDTLNLALENLSAQLGNDILTYKKRYTAGSKIKILLDTKNPRPEIQKTWIVNRNKFAARINDADLNEFVRPTQAPVTQGTY